MVYVQYHKSQAQTGGAEGQHPLRTIPHRRPHGDLYGDHAATACSSAGQARRAAVAVSWNSVPAPER